MGKSKRKKRKNKKQIKKNSKNKIMWNQPYLASHQKLSPKGRKNLQKILSMMKIPMKVSTPKLTKNYKIKMD